jgi:hypothetical protein
MAAVIRTLSVSSLFQVAEQFRKVTNCDTLPWMPKYVVDIPDVLLTLFFSA